MTRSELLQFFLQEGSQPLKQFLAVTHPETQRMLRDLIDLGLVAYDKRAAFPLFYVVARRGYPIECVVRPQ